MIKAINNQRLIMICHACGQENTIPLAALRAGTEGDSKLVAVACPGCPKGAVEFLNRTWDNPGGHARMVNSLHSHLVKKGQVAPLQAEKLRNEPEADRPFNAEELSGSDQAEPSDESVMNVAKAIQATVDSRLGAPGSKGAVAKL